VGVNHSASWVTFPDPLGAPAVSRVLNAVVGWPPPLTGSMRETDQLSPVAGAGVQPRVAYVTSAGSASVAEPAPPFTTGHHHVRATRQRRCVGAEVDSRAAVAAVAAAVRR